MVFEEEDWLMCVRGWHGREDEKVFLEQLQESISKGTTWERITDLVDLQNSRTSPRTSLSSLTDDLALILHPPPTHTRVYARLCREQDPPSFGPGGVGSGQDERGALELEEGGGQGARCRWILRGQRLGLGFSTLRAMFRVVCFI